MICHFVLQDLGNRKVCVKSVHSVSQMIKRCTELQLVKTSSRPVRNFHTLSFALLLEMSVGYFSMIMKQNTRAVWKVSSHYEYLENWWHDLDVTWQPVRGDLCEQFLSLGASQSAVRRC